MKHRIKTADDIAWLLDHTQAFRGGQVTDLHIHKRRLLDEATGREVTAGTTLTAMIRYDTMLRGIGGPHAVTRTAKLLMVGATDFSIFEQEGSDFSELGAVHADASGGRLRFWFDPAGELYVVCDEAELEEVSTPGPAKPVRSGLTEWTFQARAGTLPSAAWLLERLDQVGLPCAWRAGKRSASSHPTWRWEGHLLSAQDHERSGNGHTGPRTGVSVQAFGPLDGSTFVITLRTDAPHEGGTSRLFVTLADLIARSFAGTCLTGRQILDGEDWLGEHGLGPVGRHEQGEPMIRADERRDA